MAIARGEITITELYDGDNFYRAWADTPDGKGNFTTEESDRAYLGVYSGREEPTHFSQYKWSRILGESAITAILSNDSHQIGTDEKGNNQNYTGAKTTVAVFHGGKDDTSNWEIDSIQIEPEGAVIGEIIDTYTYKVVELKTDEASVTFKLTHKKNEYSPLEKTFTLSKNKQGISGQHATSYFLSFNDTALKKFRETGTMEPAELMMQGMSIKADQKPVPQSGYFKIYEQSEIALDRDQYEQAYVDKKLDEEELYVISEKNYPLILTYTSKEPEERLTYEYTDLIDIMSIKVYWYRDADFEELIDVQTISITSDGEKGDPGEKGSDGVSITSVDVEYAQSTSAIHPPTIGWNTNAPDWKDGHYMWSRTKTTYSSGKPTYSEPICITGQKGETGGTGNAGQGIKSITEQYYLSDSKDELTGGSWTITPPKWKEGEYIWTQSIIEWINPTDTTETTPVVNSVWEIINETTHETQQLNSMVQDYKNQASLQVGMKVGYSGFNTLNASSVYICGLDYNMSTGQMELANKPGTLYVNREGKYYEIPNQPLPTNSLPQDITAYIVWDNTLKRLFYVYYETKMTKTGVESSRWREILDSTVTFTDSHFILGEVET